YGKNCSIIWEEKAYLNGGNSYYVSSTSYSKSVICVLLFRTPDPQGKLPQETLDASGLKKCFLKKGFS
ncbi:hypothetical protein BHM03_00046607, partial [Ensete ventricosum]